MVVSTLPFYAKTIIQPILKLSKVQLGRFKKKREIATSFKWPLSHSDSKEAK
jgi:hypothetical protein